MSAARVAIGNSAGATLTLRDGTEVTSFTDVPAQQPPALDDDWPAFQPAAPWRTTEPEHVHGMNVYVGDRLNALGGAKGIWEGPTLLDAPTRLVNLAQGQTPDPADLVAGVIIGVDEP